MTKWFNVGKIVNTHGIRGEVRVISRTDFPEERYRVGNKLYMFQEKSNEPLEVKIASHRTHKNFDLLTFEGLEDVNQVEKLKGAVLKVPEEQLGALPEGEYYYHEIIGCTVVTEDGEEIGKIIDILSPGANDVWVVKGPKGKEHYIPYIEQVVLAVDVQEKRVTIHPMEGLLS
ncbi:ribosome maturation factor RimM [Ectobacillus ponti]|uniref:Ribosome maturation factor RimM n=1 Tax=Ectobacillus ponti TaxID=2961894 RepID=A0AA41XAI6_9BACI|nr:ribosome maturation factor RimM [Ectobacillus ponti]MCP8970158.1 ribosome maturation factor RimM [Ectobacillus ponti]